MQREKAVRTWGRRLGAAELPPDPRGTAGRGLGQILPRAFRRTCTGKASLHWPSYGVCVPLRPMRTDTPCSGWRIQGLADLCDGQPGGPHPLPCTPKPAPEGGAPSTWPCRGLSTGLTPRLGSSLLWGLSCGTASLLCPLGWVPPPPALPLPREAERQGSCLLQGGHCMNLNSFLLA